GMRHEVTDNGKKVQFFFGFTLCAMLFGLSFTAEAQQPTKKNVRIGFLAQVSSSAISARIDAFRQGLRELGYVEGQNLKIEWRDASGDAHRLDGPQSRRHPLAWSDGNPCLQGSDFHDSYCYGAGY